MEGLKDTDALHPKALATSLAYGGEVAPDLLSNVSQAN